MLNLLITFSYTTETESELAEKSSWNQANRGEKLGLVWRNRKKISQIINDYLYLPFFLLNVLKHLSYPEGRHGRAQVASSYISLVLLGMGWRGRRNSSVGVRSQDASPLPPSS
jgi:hypothetical protein